MGRMTPFEPAIPDFKERIEASFERQKVMALIGARLVRIDPGEVEIELAYREDLTQQHGYLHAGISTTIADSAGGYAAYSLMPAGASVLAVEYKVNLIAPAKGEAFRAVGRVKRAGRTLTVTEIEVFALDGTKRTSCLFGTQTVLCLRDVPDTPARG